MRGEGWPLKLSTFNFQLSAPVLVCSSRPFCNKYPASRVMPTEVKIPALGESISSGLISQWHKKDGETVKAGDVLLTLETDKVAQEIAADASGVLRHKAKEGDDVAVGALVAVIEEGGGAPEDKGQQATSEAAAEAPVP